jgi:uncharacterized membrane protein
MKLPSATIVAGLVSGFVAVAAAEPARNFGPMTELSPLVGFAGSEAYAINDTGTIVGWSTGPGFAATKWEGGVAISLGLAGRAAAINAHGDIAGHAIPPGSPPRAFRQSASGTTILLQPLPGAPASIGLGLNEHGDVVGHSGGTRATLWRADGETIALPALPGYLTSQAWAINASRVITGLSGLASGVTVPVVWIPRLDGSYDVRELRNGISEGQPFAGGMGRAINDAGQVVGFERLFPHAWTIDASGPVTRLHATASYGPEGGGNAVNARGEIVGYAGVNVGGFPTLERKDRDAAYWPSATGRPVLLGRLPGGSNGFGRGINIHADIVGTADNADGAQRGFVIWSP